MAQEGTLDAEPDEESSFSLQTLAGGLHVPLNVPGKCRPNWLDERQLRLGRNFATRYLFGLVYSEMLSLAMLFSFRRSLEPLIYTGKSHTPYAAFRRYLSTVTRIVSWYEGDAWEAGSEAQRNMAAVHLLHDSVAKSMNEARGEDIAARITLKGVWCPYIAELKEDFGGGDEAASDPCFEKNDGAKTTYFNQLDMSLTQFGFVGLMVLFPERFGAHDASDEELEGFVHLWRGLGHLLGIEDRYNFCAGGLAETRARSRAVLERWVKPQLSRVTQDWEHMFRCVVEGISYYVPGNTFGGAMAYLCWVIGISVPRLHTVMSWRERFFFLLHRLVLCYVLRFPGALAYHNWLLRLALRRARNASSSWLQSKRDGGHDYHKMAPDASD